MLRTDNPKYFCNPYRRCQMNKCLNSYLELPLNGVTWTDGESFFFLKKICQNMNFPMCSSCLIILKFKNICLLCSQEEKIFYYILMYFVYTIHTYTYKCILYFLLKTERSYLVQETSGLLYFFRLKYTYLLGPNRITDPKF